MRTVFAILLLLSLTLPLFQLKTHDTTDYALEYIKGKVMDGNWGRLAQEVMNISEKVLQEENEFQKNIPERIKNHILTGYGFGYSSIGAVVLFWKNFRFKRFEIITVLPLFIIVIVLIQVIFHNYFYRQRNAILSVLSMMLALSIFGNCIGHEYYSGYLIGILLFLMTQITYMIYFYWFPYKNITAEYNENQSS